MFKVRSRPPSSLSDVYASCMASYIWGYPLWFPELHDTGEPQIGDVGYLDEGAFVRLFNINVAKAGHEVTRWDPPFVVVEPLDSKVFGADPRKVLLPGRYSSHETGDLNVEALLSLYVVQSLNLRHVAHPTQRCRPFASIDQRCRGLQIQREPRSRPCSGQPRAI